MHSLSAPKHDGSVLVVAVGSMGMTVEERAKQETKRANEARDEEKRRAQAKKEAGAAARAEIESNAKLVRDAAKIGNDQEVKRLLKLKASPSIPDILGFTALHKIAMYDHSTIAPLLIKAGAPVDELEGRGMTPLMLAVANGFTDTARVLLNAGASTVVKCTEKEYTPLMHAARYGHTDCCRLLLGHEGRTVNSATLAADERQQVTARAALLARKQGHTPTAEYLDEVAAQLQAAQAAVAKAAEQQPSTKPSASASFMQRAFGRSSSERDVVPRGAVTGGSVTPSAAVSQTEVEAIEAAAGGGASFVQRQSESFVRRQSASFVKRARQLAVDVGLFSGQPTTQPSSPSSPPAVRAKPQASVLSSAGALAPDDHAPSDRLTDNAHDSTPTTPAVLSRPGSRWTVVQAALHEARRENLPRGTDWWNSAAGRIRDFFGRREAANGNNAVVKL